MTADVVRAEVVDAVPQHLFDADIDYEHIVEKISKSSSNSIEERFNIGKLVRLALTEGFKLEVLAADTGFTEVTLKRYMRAWDFWGEDRIPGDRVTWTIYTQHLSAAWRRRSAHTEEWMKAVDYKQTILGGGREAAEELARAFVLHDAKPRQLTLAEKTAINVNTAISKMWNARAALHPVNFAKLSDEEAQRLAEEFEGLVRLANEFRKTRAAKR